MHRVRALIVIALLLLAAGCGGQPPSSTDAAPAAPVLQLAVAAPKTLQFTWADVATETEYRLRERIAGASAYADVAAMAADTEAHDLDVFLPARIGADYVLRACNAAGCTDSNEVQVAESFAQALAYLKASNTDAGDEFGWGAFALSSDGTTLAVGARNEDSDATGIDGDGANDAATDAGAAYVFVRDGSGVWVQQAYVKASNTGAGDLFGYALALSDDGDTMVVSAILEDGADVGIDGDETSDAMTNSGAAYVFVRDGAGTWTQQAYVKASNTGFSDHFGSTVALSGDGDTLAVGAIYEDSASQEIDGDQSDNSAYQAGAVYVYTRSGTTWEQQVYIKASEAAAGDWFGQNVVLSRDGTTLAVSANRTFDAGIQSGSAYVFVRAGTTWTEQARLTASNPGGFDLFGTTLAISSNGDTLAVSAFREDSGATGVDGDQGDDSATDSGAVYVFTRTGTDWSQQAYIKASNTGAGDVFGQGVALTGDGDTLAVGAPGEGSSATLFEGDQEDDSAPWAGAVYVFMRSTDGVWSQKAYVKAPNTAAGAGFGGVKLSGDGTILAVGAAGEASAAIGVDGDQTDTSAPAAGAVYIY